MTDRLLLTATNLAQRNLRNPRNGSISSVDAPFRAANALYHSVCWNFSPLLVKSLIPTPASALYYSR